MTTDPKPVPINAKRGYLKIMENHKRRKENQELHPSARLTVELVRLIRKDTRSCYEIGKQLGVSGALISGVKRRKTYAWVEDEEPETN